MVRGVQHPSLEEALVAHRTARLNVFGRQLLVSRIELDRWPVAKAAEAQGVSRTTAHKWIRRYRAVRFLQQHGEREHGVGQQLRHPPDRIRRHHREREHDIQEGRERLWGVWGVPPAIPLRDVDREHDDRGRDFH